MPSARMRSVSSATWMNSSGGIEPELGVVEAGERLDAEDAGRRDRDDRLEVHVDLVVVERGPQRRARAGGGARPARAGRRRRSRSGCRPAPWPGAWRRARRAAAPRRRRRRRSANAMPMLACSAGWRPFERRIGSAITRSSSAARCATGSMPVTSLHITMNSSPAMRPTRSIARVAPCSRWAISVSTSSPLAWPSVSLTSLNRSRSMKSTAVFVCCRGRARACAAGCRRTPCGCTGR